MAEIPKLLLKYAKGDGFLTGFAGCVLSLGLIATPENDNIPANVGSVLLYDVAPDRADISLDPPFDGNVSADGQHALCGLRDYYRLADRVNFLLGSVVHDNGALVVRCCYFGGGKNTKCKDMDSNEEQYKLARYLRYRRTC